MNLQQCEQAIARAREILANQTFPVLCDCGAPERGHTPDCSLVLAEEDAWEQAQEELWEKENN